MPVGVPIRRSTGSRPSSREPAVPLIPQRPKIERYEGHLLIILREIRFPEPPEQVSLFLGDRVVVSFQERPGDAFDPIRRVDDLVPVGGEELAQVLRVPSGNCCQRPA